MTKTFMTARRHPRIAHTLPALRARACAMARAPTTRSRWFRPWAHCMPAISRWCASRNAAPTASWSRSSSTRRNSRRNEDLGTYPRTFAADIAALAALKADLVWAPAVETMYPDGFATRIVPEGPALAGLEDAFRPHFFAGVATVVAKLLIQCAARYRAVRREGFSAAQSRHAACPRPRSCDPHRRRARRARGRRPRAVLAQPLSLAATARRGAGRFIARSPTAPNGSPPAAPSPRPCGKAAPRSSSQASRSITSKRATPRRWRRSTSARDGPIRLLVAARIGRTRLIDNVGV